MAFASAVLLAGVVYLNALDNPFIYDDQRLIVENVALETPSRVVNVLRRDATRPIVALSYAIDRVVWGPTPFGFHLTSVLLHMLNTGLLFLVAWRVLEDRVKAGLGGVDVGLPLVASTAAAVVFATHPMMTQAVGYISGRSEVISTTWLLLALLSARSWFLTGRAASLAVTFALWLAAMMSKETAIVFPVALLAFDRLVYPTDAAGRRWRLFWLHVPLVTFAIVGAFLRLVVLTLVEHPGSFGLEASYVVLQVDVLRRYVGLLLGPSGQSIFHEVTPLAGVSDPRLLVGVAVLGLLVFAAWRERRRAPLVAFGLTWFLVMLLPSMALVVLDRAEPVAEHRVYGAAAGFFLAVGYATSRLAARLARARRVTRRVAAVGAVVLVASLGARTMLRNAVWADPVTLWTEAVLYAPAHWVPNLALGEALQEAGRHDEAIGRLAIAIAAHPDEPVAYRLMGVSLLEAGAVEEARGVFEELRRRWPESNEATNGLGAVALLMGQVDEARRYYAETLERDRWNIAAHKALAAMDEATDPASALRHCEAIAEAAPGTAGIEECINRNRSRVEAVGTGSGSGD